MSNPTIFISYSHKDELEKQALLLHLGVLENEKLIDLWVDDKINAGGDWSAEIEDAVGKANVAILLVTANFLNSSFILKEEVPKLLRRRREEGLIVFPIIAKACAWEKVSWLSKMNLRPKNGAPIWRDGGQHVDEELASIAREIARIVESSPKKGIDNLTAEADEQVPEELHNIIEIQSQVSFKDEIVDQNVVPIFVRELDLAGFREKPSRPTTFSSFTEELIQTRKNTLVIGEAGVGKSTELLKLTRQLSIDVLLGKKACLIPIYVELRHFTSAAGKATDVIDYIGSLSGISTETQRSMFLSGLRKSKRFIFLLDGLNEIKYEQRSESINALIKFIKQYPNAQYLISTRYFGFDEQFLNISGVPFGCYEIQMWNDTQLMLFFKSNGALDSLGAIDPKISELCRVPFVAHLLLNVIKSQQYEDDKNYPKNRAQLYRSYIDYIFSRREYSGSKFTKNEKISLLSIIAYSMNEQGTLSWKYKYIENLPTSDVERISLIEIVQEIVRNGILRQGDMHFLQNLDDETPIEFLHQSLQEFFTALYIVQRPKHEFLSFMPMDSLEKVYWRDIPVYVAGLLDDPLTFIHSLLEHKKRDDYLLIAAKCLMACSCDSDSYSEMLNSIVEDHLIDSMQNDRYTKDAIEIVHTLGTDAVEILLSHLDNANEIIEVRALTGHEDIERRWRKYGRIIYILGELHAYRIVDKLNDICEKVKDTHLLYHIVIALYTLGNNEAMELLGKSYFRSHPDPVVRALSTLAELKLNHQEYLPVPESKELVEALTTNINNQNEMEYALRAHSAEVLGLLGLREAIIPLADLLRKEKRVEPQSSAIKALGYIATKHRQSNINDEIADALIAAIEHGTVYSNQWGKKLLKELLTLVCSKSENYKLNNAIKRINRSEESELVRQSKVEVLEDFIRGRQTRE